jgi:hypothetical protein
MTKVALLAGRNLGQTANIPDRKIKYSLVQKLGCSRLLTIEADYETGHNLPTVLLRAAYAVELTAFSVLRLL